MRMIISIAKYYDWEPVPAGVEVTEADVKANRVKPALDGSWLMRITVAKPTYTEVMISEGALIDLLLQDAMKDGAVLSRADAAGIWVARHVAAHHFHRSWVTSIEVSDDGPATELFEERFIRLLEVGLLQPEDHDDLLASYTGAASAEQIADRVMLRVGAKKGGS